MTRPLPPIESRESVRIHANDRMIIWMSLGDDLEIGSMPFMKRLSPERTASSAPSNIRAATSTQMTLLRGFQDIARGGRNNSFFEECFGEDEAYFSLANSPYDRMTQLPEQEDGLFAILLKMSRRSDEYHRRRDARNADAALSPEARCEIARVQRAELEKSKYEEEGAKRMRELRAQASKASPSSTDTFQTAKSQLSTAYLKYDDSDIGPSSPLEAQSTNTPVHDSVPSIANGQMNVNDLDGILDWVQVKARKTGTPSDSRSTSPCPSSKPSVSNPGAESPEEAQANITQLPVQLQSNFDDAFESNVTPSRPPISDHSNEKTPEVGVDADAGARRLEMLTKHSRKQCKGPKTQFQPSYSRDEDLRPARPFTSVKRLPGSELCNLGSVEVVTVSSRTPHQQSLSGLAMLAEKRALQRKENDSMASVFNDTALSSTAIAPASSSFVNAPRSLANTSASSSFNSVTKPAGLRNNTKRSSEEETIVVQHEACKDRVRDIKALRDAYREGARLYCWMGGYTQILKDEVAELRAFATLILDQGVPGHERRRRIIDIKKNFIRRHSTAHDVVDETAVEAAMHELAGNRLIEIATQIEVARHKAEVLGLRRTEQTKNREKREKRSRNAPPSAKAEREVKEKQPKLSRSGARIACEDRLEQAERLKIALWDVEVDALKQGRPLLHGIKNGHPRYTTDDATISLLGNERRQKQQRVHQGLYDSMQRGYRKAAGETQEDEDGEDKEDALNVEHKDKSDAMEVEKISITESYDSDDDSSDGAAPNTKYTVNAAVYGYEKFGFQQGVDYTMATIFGGPGRHGLREAEERVDSLVRMFYGLYSNEQGGVLDREVLISVRDGRMEQKLEFHAGVGCRVWIEMEELRPDDEDMVGARTMFAVLWERTLDGVAQKPYFDEVRQFASSVHANAEAKSLILEWYGRHLGEYLEQIGHAMNEQMAQAGGLFEWADDFENGRDKMRVWVKQIQ